jgi:hypothetical protein
MTAVMLAIFNRFSDAESVRTELVRDGFPTDRVKLTASREKGRAGLQPLDSSHGQFVQYFGTLFDQEGERVFVEELAKRVASGSVATIAVHPRGNIETSRATEILEKQGALQVVPHNLENQAFESAASSEASPWLDYLLPEPVGDAGRFYLRLLPEGEDQEQLSTDTTRPIC